VKLELGLPRATKEIDAPLIQIKKSHGSNVILIGRAPCQARSVIGGSDNNASNDHRHFLYNEYVTIVWTLMPGATRDVGGENGFEGRRPGQCDVGGQPNHCDFKNRSRSRCRLEAARPAKARARGFV
jgi:hypothetical protein